MTISPDDFVGDEPDFYEFKFLHVFGFPNQKLFVDLNAQLRRTSDVMKYDLFICGSESTGDLGIKA